MSFQGWIALEDAALKYKLQGLKVEDANAPAGGRSVKVRYRLPETELADLDYPIVIIDHLGFTPAPERMHRGHIQLSYAPYGHEKWWGDDDQAFSPKDSPLYADYPIPMNMDYQVTVMTRKALHILPLTQQLAAMDRLPPLFGYLEIPGDHTVRSLDLMAGPDIRYGKDGDDKSIHRATYMVRVFSELIPSDVLDMRDPINARVKQINLNVGIYTDENDILFGLDGTVFSRIGKSVPFNWNTIRTPM